MSLDFFQLDGGRPGDRRGFVHKRIGRAVGGFVKGGPLGAVTGFLTPPRPAARPVAPRSETARTSLSSAAGKDNARMVKFGGGGGTILDRAKGFLGFNGGNGNGDDGCVRPFRRDPGSGKCKIFVGDRAGPNGGREVGEAVMGRYGAGLEPGIMTIDRAVCLPGMQLGDDGLCYNKSQISNKQRMWPRGRRPLLTGGQMRAISIAAGAAKQVSGATKRLQSLGLLKKPTTRRAPKTTAVVVHDDHHHHSEH